MAAQYTALIVLSWKDDAFQRVRQNPTSVDIFCRRTGIRVIFLCIFFFTKALMMNNLKINWVRYKNLEAFECDECGKIFRRVDHTNSTQINSLGS